MSGPSHIDVDSSPRSIATSEPGPGDPALPPLSLESAQPGEPKPRSRSRSPVPSRVTPSAPPSPPLWWVDEPTSAPPSPLFWWTEPLDVPPPLARTPGALLPNAPSSSGRCPSAHLPCVSACSAASAQPASGRCPPFHLPCVSACSAPSVQPSSGRCPSLHLSSVSACSASSVKPASGRCPPLHLPCVSACSASSVQPMVQHVDDSLLTFLDEHEESPPRPPPPPPAPPSPPEVMPPMNIWQSWEPKPELLQSATTMLDRITDTPGRVRTTLAGVHPLGRRFAQVFHEAVMRIMGETEHRGKYYIGVTCDPFRRFWGHEEHKHHHYWEIMAVVAVSTSTGIKRLETMVLADNRVGLRNRFCKNIGPGGEGVANAASPLTAYFLYVVYNLAW